MNDLKIIFINNYKIMLSSPLLGPLYGDPFKFNSLINILNILNANGTHYTTSSLQYFLPQKVNMVKDLLNGLQYFLEIKTIPLML